MTKGLPSTAFQSASFLQSIDDPHVLARALRESYELMVLAERSAGIGIWDFEFSANCTRGTPQFFRNMGLEPSDGPVPIERIRALRHPDDRQRVFDGFQQALDEGRDSYETEYRVILPDGQVRWISGRGRVLRDESGKPVRYIGVDIDITQRKQAEDALRESEERFSKAFHAAAHPMSISTLKDGRYLDMNAAALAASGRRRDEVIGRTVQELGFYNDPGRFQRVRDLLAEHGRFTDLETELHGAEGVGTFLLSGARIDLRGEACVLISAVDITARKRAEEHVALLMQEVNHRSNNLLAVVQAIVQQMARFTGPEDFAGRLSERLVALAASNRLLISGKWQGVDMAALVRSQLSHFRDLIGTRITLEGPPALLEPPAAQTIGMALHELATNAGKYGALSDAKGQVRIRWKVAGEETERRFHLSWTEYQGPAVKTPERSGFGHVIMVRFVQASLGGKVKLEFRPQGLSWNFHCPASRALSA